MIAVLFLINQVCMSLNIQKSKIVWESEAFECSSHTHKDTGNWNLKEISKHRSLNIEFVFLLTEPECFFY